MGQAGMPTKPDPTSTLHILKKLGVKPTRAYLVGDSDIDVQTAINAGITPIGVEWGYRDSLLLRKTGAEYIAESPEQIYEILLPLVRKEKK
jgi:phosphoglycolate phosphatase